LAGEYLITDPLQHRQCPAATGVDFRVWKARCRRQRHRSTGDLRFYTFEPNFPQTQKRTQFRRDWRGRKNEPNSGGTGMGQTGSGSSRGAETLRLSERKGVWGGCGLLAQRLVRHYQRCAFARSQLSDLRYPEKKSSGTCAALPFLRACGPVPPWVDAFRPERTALSGERDGEARFLARE